MSEVFDTVNGASISPDCTLQYSQTASDKTRDMANKVKEELIEGCEDIGFSLTQSSSLISLGSQVYITVIHNNFLCYKLWRVCVIGITAQEYKHKLTSNHHKRIPNSRFTGERLLK